MATGVLGFVTAILFLFCTPDLDTLFSLNAPQPFVLIYALALGKGGSVFMTIIAVIGLILVSAPPSPLYANGLTPLSSPPALPSSPPPASSLPSPATASSRYRAGSARSPRMDSPRTPSLSFTFSQPPSCARSSPARWRSPASSARVVCPPSPPMDSSRCSASS